MRSSVIPQGLSVATSPNPGSAHARSAPSAAAASPSPAKAGGGGGKGRWELAMKADLEKVLVPEPQHRIAPEGAGSGISVRRLPMPCTEQIRLICQHYVNKCSGQYENNKLAARYVHQMASEVISQLSGVSAEIDIVRSNVELMEQRIKEWEDHFPSSLKGLGNPAAIADLIQKQKKQIHDLTKALSAEKTMHEKDVSDALRSMNAQLQASRNSSVLERQQIALTHATEEEELKRKLAILEHQQEMALEVIKRDAQSEISKVKQTMQAQHNEAIKTAKDSGSKKLAQVKAAYKKKMRDFKNVYQHNIDTMERHIHTLEDKVLTLHTELNGEDNMDDLDIPEYQLQLETMTIGSTIGDLTSDDASSHAVSIADDYDDFNGGDESAPHDHMQSQARPKSSGHGVTFSPPTSPKERIAELQRGSDARKSGTVRRAANVELLRDNSTLRTKVSNLTQDNMELKASLDDLHEHLSALETRFKESTGNYDRALKRIKALEATNEELLSSLSDSLRAVLVPPVGITVKAEPKPLSHVPHFLMRADKTGLA